MKRLPLVLSALALLVALASPVAAKVANVTNPMTSDLNAADHQITNLSQITSSTGAAIELNAQGELSLYSAFGAPGAYLAADGGAGALVQVNGQGAGFPGDGNLAVWTLTADVGIVWNDGGALRVSSG